MTRQFERWGRTGRTQAGPDAPRGQPGRGWDQPAASGLPTAFLRGASTMTI
ncbi:Uncharacterised protein [Bordetella pertussis]|nr:Uncharacterised protein [Bordetella pertussis]CFP60571.1 Uncharacterised protein [Bordetella pertussis]